MDSSPHLPFFGSHISETSATYPALLEIAPTKKHRITFILLHGRGSEANSFGSFLLHQKISLGGDITDEQNLRVVFPDAKFVFPTAAQRLVKSSNRAMSNQWFDYHAPLNVAEQCRNEDWQIEGLRETCKFIHSLLHHEISIIGARNVVLGGLSQGCAASLTALLLWDGPPLKAMIGMCGWLPLRKRIEDMARASNSDWDEEDHVEFREDEDINANLNLDGCTQALQYLRDQLNFSSDGSAPSKVYQQVPIFLGHGTQDEKVPIDLDREAARCLELLEANVESIEYQDLGHWYSSHMLGDITRFLLSLENQKSIFDDTWPI